MEPTGTGLAPFRDTRQALPGFRALQCLQNMQVWTHAFFYGLLAAHICVKQLGVIKHATHVEEWS